MSRQLHPDKHVGATVEEERAVTARMQKLNEATAARTEQGGHRATLRAISALDLDPPILVLLANGDHDLILRYRHVGDTRLWRLALPGPRLHHAEAPPSGNSSPLCGGLIGGWATQSRSPRPVHLLFVLLLGLPDRLRHPRSEYDESVAQPRQVWDGL